MGGRLRKFGVGSKIKNCRLRATRVHCTSEQIEHNTVISKHWAPQSWLAKGKTALVLQILLQCFSTRNRTVRPSLDRETLIPGILLFFSHPFLQFTIRFYHIIQRATSPHSLALVIHGANIGHPKVGLRKVTQPWYYNHVCSNFSLVALQAHERSRQKKQRKDHHDLND